MKHSHALPLAPRSFESLRSERPPWAERAIGAAAAAVFLAGIVSAGIVESQSGPDGPMLAAPAAAAAPSGGGAVRSVDHVLLPPAGTSTGTQSTGHGGGTKTTGAASGGGLARSVGSIASHPSSTVPGSNPTPPSPPPTTDPPAAHGQDSPPVVTTLPTVPLPDDGVTVGPVTVDTSPSGGATATLTLGIVDPIVVSFP